MLKDMTYKEKFELLNPWMPVILESIKKDIKQEHLQTDRLFTKTHFPGKQVLKLTVSELASAYSKALAGEDAEKLGEFIAVRWVLKNTDVYHFFEKKLKEIDPDFEKLETLDAGMSKELMDSSIAQFGAVKTYLFSILNSVVFPASIYEELHQKAMKEGSVAQEASKSMEELSVDALKKQHEYDLNKIVDKYEKKISGLQKMYLTDTEILKKQIGQLQRKLQGKQESCVK